MATPRVTRPHHKRGPKQGRVTSTRRGRDKKGHFTKGPMSEEMKKKISEGQARRHARNRALQEGAPAPTHKKCSQCQVVKPLNAFVTRHRVLKSGEKRSYPSGECRECGAERRRRWEQSQPPERRRERQRRWNANRDKKKRNAYQREYQAFQRRMAGASVRGPWKKYRQGQASRVPIEPLAAWLTNHLSNNKIHVVDAALACGYREEKPLRNVLNRDTETIDLDKVDRILMGLQQQHMLNELYPIQRKEAA